MLPEVMREAARESAGSSGCVARPNNRHGLSVEQTEVDLRDQQRRRIFELGQ